MSLLALCVCVFFFNLFSNIDKTIYIAAIIIVLFPTLCSDTFKFLYIDKWDLLSLYIRGNHAEERLLFYHTMNIPVNARDVSLASALDDPDVGRCVRERGHFVLHCTPRTGRRGG